MNDSRAIAEEFQKHLAATYETMAGERPELQLLAPANLPDAAAGLRWRQPFSGFDGVLSIGASEGDWKIAVRPILRAAGLEDDDAASLKSTYLETLGQALSGLAQAIGAQSGHEVSCAGGEEVSGAPQDTWIPLSITLGPDHATLWIAYEAPELTVAPVVAPAPETSRTFDLLLEVELPVSVSFGRAQVPLKDVLRLTTGSIVELNRGVGDPVEVIVNNCVIARGEAVVIEGNFGVRIQQVISRGERLRTLN